MRLSTIVYGEKQAVITLKEANGEILCNRVKYFPFIHSEYYKNNKTRECKRWYRADKLWEESEQYHLVIHLERKKRNGNTKHTPI